MVVSQELLKLLEQVLTSWEVIVVTLVLLAYFFLVFYVARLYRRPRSLSMVFKPRREKFSKRPKSASEGEGEPDIED